MTTPKDWLDPDHALLDYYDSDFPSELLGPGNLTGAP